MDGAVMAIVDLLEKPRTVELTGHQIENILQAYYALQGRSPFFSFNEPTREIIEKLKAAKER